MNTSARLLVKQFQLKAQYTIKLVQALGLAALSPVLFAADKPASCPEFLNVEVKKLHSSKTAQLCDFYQADKPLLIVNTASHCGYTKQFKGLEALYQKYKDQGFVILGFPSNSFKQEEDTEMGTANVCYQNYGVTFPMFTHVDVKGEQAHPLFKYLAAESGEPSWNFNKYLLNGEKVVHFPSSVKPLNSDLEKKLVF